MNQNAYLHGQEGRDNKEVVAGGRPGQNLRQDAHCQKIETKQQKHQNSQQ